MSIVISRNPTTNVYPGEPVYFTITSGTASSLYASFEWYLNSGLGDVLVGTDNNYTLQTQDLGHYTIYVKVTEYAQGFWHDGQFYGGSFHGNFSGGTFNYGYLNNIYYSSSPKPTSLYNT